MLEAKLVVVGGEAKQAEVRLKTLPTIIGRAREATLTLPHALVSRKHCEIFLKNGRLYVRDLGSLNGTYVNSQRIEGEQALDPDQLLTLGNVTFRAVYTPVVQALTDTVGGNSGQVDTDYPEQADLGSGVSPKVEPPNESECEAPVALSATLLPDQEPQAVAQSEPLLPDFEPVATSSSGVLHGQDSEEPLELPAESSTVDEPSMEPEPKSSDSDTGEIVLDVLNDEPEFSSESSSDIMIADEELSKGPEKSISDSALGNLPGAQKRSEFGLNPEIQVDQKVAIEEVDSVEIDLGEEESKNRDESSAELDAFVRKLPK